MNLYRQERGVEGQGRGSEGGQEEVENGKTRIWKEKNFNVWEMKKRRKQMKG